MNIITVFNYPDENNVNYMFKIWLIQAIRCKEETEGIEKIKILTKGINNTLQKYIDNLNIDYIEIKICETLKLNNPPSAKWNHNVGFKLFNICKETEPYIFVDADAIIMTDMNDVISASKDKPFIAVNHQTIPGHTTQFKEQFINTGFLIVSDPTFLNFEKIYYTPLKYKNCTGTDQLLTYNYCKTIGYDYTHELIHWGWNSCGGYKKLLENGDIVSTGIPEKHKVHILHYWYEFKPWINNCFIYEKLLQRTRLFELLLQKMKNIKSLNALLIFFKCQEYSKCNVLCENTELFEDVKLLNLKGIVDNINKNLDYHIDIK